MLFTRRSGPARYRLGRPGWKWALVGSLVWLLLVGWPKPAEANTEFDPGNLISDQVMADSATMTASQIQAFLEERVGGGGCDRWRESARAEARGYSPPWTCLYQFEQNPATGETNYGQFDDSGRPASVPGGLTAAEIIDQAAADHQINPQVLLVLIQKQQGLVTDSWPWPIQFSLATGWDCPISNPCDSDGTSFYRQVDGMARELRQKLGGQGVIPHQIGLNQIPYNPDIGCGLASVRIRSRATAALYSLEPYVPNQAALGNPSGAGDECSSYGIRNFWLQFLTWFGPPNITSQEASGLTTPVIVSFRGQRFDPGNLISDQVMADSATMTASQIQAFLEERVGGGGCDRWRESARAEARGYSPPWTCLYQFEQNPATGETNYGQFDDSGRPESVPGGLTAAEIIDQAAADHQINPQVLLVMLQKEQELVTDNWPWSLRFARATGWGCPDSRDCSPETAGFYQQVDNAARGLRGYIDNLESWWYRVGTNQINYHPNRDCGSQTVNIKNRATAALYLYTPYVPNQAALDNLHGTGDDCSSYGNRNFWVQFLVWFGNPTRTTGRPAATTARPRPSIQAPARFTPGNIISDQVLGRSTTMTASQIQAFLEQQLGAGGCNRQQTSSAASRRGYSPPWTCLYQFEQNPATGETNYGQFDDSGRPESVPGGLTAAEIIDQAATDHRINPQVILVMLEINHHLVTDDWPWPIQFDRAANWSCGESGCPAGPAGFSQQINILAQRLRSRQDNPAQARYRVGRQTLAYHPDPTCGLGMVNIKTQATAVIYDQYAYLPNQSVVSNYPADGDDCGSYQIRDFWRLFKAWFQTTH